MLPWRALQLADAGFPTGGFAHSAGLEAAVQQGEVTGATLAGFLEESLWQVGLAALPFVRAAALAPSELTRLDHLAEAFLANHVARRASVTQGRALAATLARVFDEAHVRAIDASIRERHLRGHHAPVYGAAFAALGVDEDTAAQLFVHQSLRGVVSAAVRLGLVGPHEGQRHVDALAPLETRVLETTRHLSVEEAAQPAPLYDLFAMNHDRLYARLFLS